MRVHRSGGRRTLALLSLALPAPPLPAGEAHLVKDVNTSPAELRVPANAVRFAEAAGLVFFPAFDPEHGWELWRSDGTPEGTVLIFRGRGAPFFGACAFPPAGPWCVSWR